MRAIALFTAFSKQYLFRVTITCHSQLEEGLPNKMHEITTKIKLFLSETRTYKSKAKDI